MTHDSYRKAIEYLLSKGIDPFWIITIIGVVMLYSERSNIKNWKSLSSVQKQYQSSLITLYVLFTLIGILHFLFGVGKW